MACFGKPDVVVTYKRDGVLQMLKDQRGQEVQAGIQESAVD